MKNVSGLEKHEIRDISAAMIARYGDNYLEYRNIFKSFPPPRLELPLHLDIDIIDSCNLRCAMCHQSYRKRTNKKIELEYIEKAIRESLPRLASVNFGASCEPLLDKETLYKSIDIANNYNIMDTFLHTNAILLDKECSVQLIDRELKHICISLDADTEETYKIMRKSDKFDTIINNINTFLEERGERLFPQLRVSFCVTNLNIHEKDRFLQRWENIADVVDFQQYRSVDGVDERLEKSASKKTTCHQGKIRGMLWPNGDITACCGAWAEVSFGNIAKTSMREIWNSERAEALRNHFRDEDVGHYPDVCRMCLGINEQ